MAMAVRNSTPGMFLVTMATHKLRPVFATSRLAELFIDTLLGLRTRGLFKVHAYLVLPERVHLLLSPNATPLPRAIEVLQAGFAERLDNVQLVWNVGFDSHPIRSLRDLETLRSHLHQLPVRANLTATPELYPYSSASRLR
jgi:putative transposase